jgi:hypothetical protein
MPPQFPRPTKFSTSEAANVRTSLSGMFIGDPFR